MRKPKNTVISETNVTDKIVPETKEAQKETIELKEESAPVVVEEVLVAPVTKKAPGRKPSTKKTTTKTAKSTTKKDAAVTTRKPRTSKAEVEFHIQYDGKEFLEKEIVEKIQNIWVNEMGNSITKLKDLKIYFKPEENTVYYVCNDDKNGGSFPL